MKAKKKDRERKKTKERIGLLKKGQLKIRKIMSATTNKRAVKSKMMKKAVIVQEMRIRQRQQLSSEPFEPILAKK